MTQLLGMGPAGRALIGAVLVAIGVLKPAAAIAVIGALLLVWAGAERHATRKRD
jgi:hypothetical protein